MINEKLDYIPGGRNLGHSWFTIVAGASDTHIQWATGAVFLPDFLSRIAIGLTLARGSSEVGGRAVCIEYNTLTLIISAAL